LKTSQAIDTWSALFLIIGIIAIAVAIIAQDGSIAVSGIACIIARPLFRGLAVLVRSAERDLFAKGDQAFAIGKDEPDENETPRS
ncbi:hypothetical protein DCD76_18930, partial [Acinetobacter baumannii]|uniref:hypothetical protein n=1 Tax=Acinetobacter baumannii TaxID=470 RepID=UPI000DE66BE1